MPILKYIFILVTSAILAACGSNTEPAPDGMDEITFSEAETSAGKPEGARYGIKSGIIRFQSSAMMMKQEIVTYFDDWGMKQRTDITMHVMGKKVHNVVITDSNYAFSYDMATKMGTKSPVDIEGSDHINFNKLAQEDMQKFNLKKTGQETVAGKKCTIYSFRDDEKKMSGTFSVWNGIVLKTESKVSRVNVSMEAYALEENPSIPSDTFIIPADVSLEETEQLFGRK
jgi:hypothetical protein